MIRSNMDVSSVTPRGYGPRRLRVSLPASFKLSIAPLVLQSAFGPRSIPRKNCQLIPLVIADLNFVLLRVLTGYQDLDDLLSFVIENGFLRNQQGLYLFDRIQSNVGLHRTSQSLCWFALLDCRRARLGRDPGRM